jgi:hypothetical protein
VNSTASDTIRCLADPGGWYEVHELEEPDTKAKLDKVKRRIAEISSRPNNVTLYDIEWVVSRLKDLGHDVRRSDNGSHIHLFVVSGVRFSVCSHNRGQRQIKPCYVREFRDAMTELKLTDEEEE